MLEFYYKQYLEEFEFEVGSLEKAMSFDEWCEWYGFDEHTPDIIILECFAI